MSAISRIAKVLSLILSLVGIQGCGKTDRPNPEESRQLSEAAEAEFLIESLYGESGVFLNDLLAELVKGKKEILFESLSEEYLADIHPEGFLMQLSNLGWELDDYGFMSISKYKDVHCYVMGCSGKRITDGKVENWKTYVPVYVIRRNGVYENDTIGLCCVKRFINRRYNM